MVTPEPEEVGMGVGSGESGLRVELVYLLELEEALL